MEIANWKSQNEILRKPGVVRWFIVSTIREKPLLSMVRYPWVCILTSRNRIYRNRTNTFFNFLHTLSRLNIFFCSLNREKGSEKSFWIFLYNAFGSWWKCQNGFFFPFRVLYKEIFIHSLPPDSPRELPFWDPFLIFQPLRRRNILKCTWRHKWATTWDDFSSSNCAQRIEFFADAMKFFPHCNICLWLQGISLLLVSAQTQKRLNFFLKSYDLCDDYCFTSPLVCVWEQIVCRRNRIALWYIRAFE